MVYKQLFLAIMLSVIVHAAIILPAPISLHKQHAKVDSKLISIDIIAGEKQSVKSIQNDKPAKKVIKSENKIPLKHKNNTDNKLANLQTKSSSNNIKNSGDIKSSSSMPTSNKISKPVYPKLARKKGYEGAVKLIAVLDDKKSVVDVKIISTSGYNMLDKSAIEAVKSSEFFGDDKEVEVIFRFRLDDYE